MHAPPGYREPRLIGVGATSRVYGAVRAAGEQPVALKRLHRQMVPSRDALARLRRELEALAELHHPAIVRFFDVVRWDGDPTIVMELIDGHDLKALVESRGPLPVEQVESVARALLSALAVVHAAGIVHRDVKPQNVRVRDDGSVVLLDFGSARLDAASQLTQTGTTVGTPEYMPPELFAGPAYDPRSDLYGVGATLFECLTGRPPHTADTLAELAFLRSETPAPAVQSLRPDTPQALAQVVDRCLSIAPEGRYATAALATWALDHPEAERLSVARRATLPSCVHCEEPTAPDALRCARCGSTTPFRFEPGEHHVAIDTVGSADGLLAWLVDLVPERGDGRSLAALTEGTAALAHGPRRLVSFVSEADARSLVARLATLSVEARVEHERMSSAAPWIVVVAVVGVLAAVAGALGAIGGLVGGVALLWLSRALRAHDDLLSPSMLPKRAGKGALTPLVLGGATLGAASLGFTSALDRLTFSGGGAVLGMSLLAVGLARRLIGLASARGPRGPEPSFRERWRGVLRSIGGSDETDGSAVIHATKVPPLLSIVLVISVLGLLPLELNTAAWMLDATRPLVARAVGAPDATRPTGAPLTISRMLSERRAQRPIQRQATSALSLMLGLVAPTLALGSIARLLVRRRRIRRRAAALLLPVGPRRRVPRRVGTASPALALPAPQDAFVAAALRRTARIAPLLDRTASDRLSRALAPITAAPDHSSALLAQCILETDPAYHLRFKLLELEGELEAEAAEQWAEKLDPHE